MADQEAPRGLIPKVSREALTRDLLGPGTPGQYLAGLAIVFGPLVVGAVVPLIAASLDWRRDALLPTIAAIVLLVVGGYAAVAAFFASAIRRGGFRKRLERVPQLDLARPPAHGSLVMIEGRVKVLEPVEGVLTGRQGAWAKTSVVVRPQPGRRRRLDAGPSFDSFSERAMFELLDASGRAVRVDPTDGALVGGRDIEDDGSHYPEGHAACLARVHVDVGERDVVHVTERVLRAGDAVAVMGVLHRGDGYRGPGEGAFVIAGDERDELTVHFGSRRELVEDLAPRPSYVSTVVALLALGGGLWLCAEIALLH